MVQCCLDADDQPMTTEQPQAERRFLRRGTDDRVIGGVASGLGDYLNVDPLLIRIGFVGTALLRQNESNVASAKATVDAVAATASAARRAPRQRVAKLRRPPSPLG